MLADSCTEKRRSLTLKDVIGQKSVEVIPPRSTSTSSSVDENDLLTDMASFSSRHACCTGVQSAPHKTASCFGD